MPDLGRGTAGAVDRLVDVVPAALLDPDDEQAPSNTASTTTSGTARSTRRWFMPGSLAQRPPRARFPPGVAGACNDASVSSPPGPAALGRGVIVESGAPAPEIWADATRVIIDDAVLQDPAATVDQLHELWASRTPVVVDLHVPREQLNAPEHDDRLAYELTPDFSFAHERCYFLVRANNYDRA